MLMNVTCWQLLHSLRQSRQHHAAHLPDVIMTYNVYATRCASGMFLSSVSFKTCSDIVLKTCPHGVRVPLPSNSLFAFLFFLRGDSNINEGQNTNLHRFLCYLRQKSLPFQDSNAIADPKQLVMCDNLTIFPPNLTRFG